jgi:hypothetical protein
MSFAPGVYLEEIPRAPRAPLETGVPAFLAVKGISEVVRLDLWDDLLDEQLTGYTRFAVRGFFANGGRRCYLVPARAGEDLAQALDRIEPQGDVDLVCAPDLVAMSAGVDALAEAQAKLVARCARSSRLFAILDPPRGGTTSIESYRASLARLLGAEPGSSSYGSVYFPWITLERACPTCLGAGRTADSGCPICRGAGTGTVPPSGHVAGVHARTDRTIGVFAAPANTVVAGAVDLDVQVSAAEDGALNARGVNVIRSFPGRGIRVWGARTLGGDAAYRYVNVRRLIITIGRWIEHAMTDLVFEPQSPLLWLRLSRQLDALLHALFQQGALVGETPAEAYYVKCDEETNPPDARASGQVVAEIGVAPARPSEFIRLDVIRGERGVSVADAG